MRTLILSDLHLGSKHCAAPRLRDLLERDSFDRLILNGDTLHSVNMKKLPGEHWHLLDLLRKIGQQRNLILIRGNHDHEAHDHPNVNGIGYSTRNILPALLEVPMVEDFQMEVAGGAYLVLHGDRFDPTLNYPLVTEVAGFCYHLTTKVNKKLAKWLKKKSRKWGGMLEFIREKALEFARQRNMLGVITGHTHFAEDTQTQDLRYLNSGCWTEGPCTYLSEQGGILELHAAAD